MNITMLTWFAVEKKENTDTLHTFHIHSTRASKRTINGEPTFSLTFGRLSSWSWADARDRVPSFGRKGAWWWVQVHSRLWFHLQYEKTAAAVLYGAGFINRTTFCWAPKHLFLWRLLQHQKLACPFSLNSVFLFQCSSCRFVSSPVIFFLRRSRG
jgi:hypothetical protein